MLFVRRLSVFQPWGTVCVISEFWDSLAHSRVDLPKASGSPPCSVSRRVTDGERISIIPARQCPNEMLIGGSRGFSIAHSWTHRNPFNANVRAGWCDGVTHGGRWRAPHPVGARTIASSRRATAMQFWLLGAIVGVCAAYSTSAPPLGLQRSACVTPLSTINVQPARTSTVCVAEASV